MKGKSKEYKKAMRDYKIHQFISKFTRPFTNFWWNLKNFIRWMPVLWNNWDWDDAFFFEVMEFKLRNMKKYFDTHHIVVSSPRIAKEIGIAAELIKRIRNEDYVDFMYEEHRKKYGKLNMEFGPSDRNGFGEVIFSHDKVDPNDTKRVEQERKDSRRIAEHSNYMMEQDLEYLFKHMRKHVRGWWD